jgi:hypothetical protein
MAKRSPSVTKKNAPKPRGTSGVARSGERNRTTHSPLATNAVGDQGPKNFKMSTTGPDSFASAMIDEYTKKGGVGQGKVGGKRVGPRPAGS